jgi:hypothetical protein
MTCIELFSMFLFVMILNPVLGSMRFIQSYHLEAVQYARLLINMGSHKPISATISYQQICSILGLSTDLQANKHFGKENKV